MSAAGSLSLNHITQWPRKKIDFQFAICPVEKGGFNKPLKATFTEFPSFLTAKICQDLDTNQNLPSDMKCPQTQQNQRL